MEQQNPMKEQTLSPNKRKFLSQTPNSNTEPLTQKAKLIPSPDESLVELKKKAADFNVEKAACWEKGDSVPFIFMAKALDAISKESDPIVITEILCNMLRTVMVTKADDLVAVVYLLSERILPHYQDNYLYLSSESIKFDLAIAEACGAQVGDIQKDFMKLKDLSLVAQERFPVSIPPQCHPLTVVEVYETFTKLAKTEPDGGGFSFSLIKALLQASTGFEALYLIRLLHRIQHFRGKLQKLEEQTLLTALGHAALYSANPPPANVDNPLELEDAAKVVKEVYSAVPIYDKLIPKLLGDVLKLRDKCTIEPGTPVKAMVHKQRTGSISTIFANFQDKEFIFQYLYPKHRHALIHYTEKGQLQIYTEDGHLIKEKYLAAASLKQPSVRSFILDCQLGQDREEEKIQPSKIHWVKNTWGLGKVCVIAYDILYLNGEVLLQKPLRVRRELLHQSFQQQSGVLQFATACTSTDLEAIEIFLAEAGCSRFIVKSLDAKYEPGKRSENWLRFEKGYVEHIYPSLELVPIAALRYRDMREDIYIFLLACYDSDKDEFQSICYLGNRLPSAILEEHYQRLYPKVISEPKANYNYYFPHVVHPVVWYEPSEVWEVKGETLTQPDAVGTLDPTKGIALSYPELVRVLPNKTPNQATSPTKAVELYKASNLLKKKKILRTEEFHEALKQMAVQGLVAKDKAKLVAKDKAKLVAKDKAKLVAKDKAKLVAKDKAKLVAKDKAKTLVENGSRNGLKQETGDDGGSSPKEVK